jgi:MOSC domain-containing protein YiiM
MVKLVTEAGRTGFYLRVLREGSVEKGAPFVLQEKDVHGVTVAFANQILHHDRSDRAGISKVLEVPALSASWRKSFLELREKSP